MDNAHDAHLETGTDLERIERIRRKLRGASYVMGGQDPQNLFEFYDKDKSAGLDQSEFRKAIRKVTPPHAQPIGIPVHLTSLC